MSICELLNIFSDFLIIVFSYWLTRRSSVWTYL